MKTLVVIAIIAGAAMNPAPETMHAQDLLKTIKQQTRQKVEARKARADSVTIERVGRTVDSTLEKTGRGMDTVVNRAAGIGNAAVDRNGERHVGDRARAHSWR